LARISVATDETQMKHRCLLLILAAAALAAAGPAAVAGWTDTRVVGPLIYRSDFPLTGLDGLLAEVAGLQTELAAALQAEPSREPIEVYLFHDQTAYRSYLSRYLPTVPYRRALYVKGRGPGRVFAAWGPEVEVDLRHECTHALLHAWLPFVPLWLDEGIAQFFETPPRQRGAARPQLEDMRRSLWAGYIPDLAKLETKTDIAEMGQAEYRDSWAWVHFMLLGPPGARQELVAYLAELRRGPSAVPLAQRLPERLPQLAAQFGDHFQSYGPVGAAQ
jgi:hypothetical protein